MLYREILEKQNYDYKKLLLESIARRYGILVHLRDNPDYLTIEEILNSFSLELPEKPKKVEEFEIQIQYENYKIFLENKADELQNSLKRMKEERENLTQAKIKVQAKMDLIEKKDNFILLLALVKDAMEEMDLSIADTSWDLKYTEESKNMTFEEFKRIQEKNLHNAELRYTEMKEKAKKPNSNELTYRDLVKELEEL